MPYVVSCLLANPAVAGATVTFEAKTDGGENARPDDRRPVGIVVTYPSEAAAAAAAGDAADGLDMHFTTAPASVRPPMSPTERKPR